MRAAVAVVRQLEGVWKHVDNANSIIQPPESGQKLLKLLIPAVFKQRLEMKADTTSDYAPVCLSSGLKL